MGKIQVRHIYMMRQMAENHVSESEIARRFEISRSTVRYHLKPREVPENFNEISGAARLLYAGVSPSEVARRQGISRNSLYLRLHRIGFRKYHVIAYRTHEAYRQYRRHTKVETVAKNAGVSVRQLYRDMRYYGYGLDSECYDKAAVRRIIEHAKRSNLNLHDHCRLGGLPFDKLARSMRRYRYKLELLYGHHRPTSL